MTSCGAGVCASPVLRHMPLKVNALSCVFYMKPSTGVEYRMLFVFACVRCADQRTDNGNMQNSESEAYCNAIV